MSSKGKFLVFEGIDGCGKGTVIESVKSHFDDNDIDYIAIKDPGFTNIGEKIRTILLDPENEEMDRETELLLFLAARAQLVNEVIRPALKSGKNVICDRYDSSTYAYQYIMGGWGDESPNEANKRFHCLVDLSSSDFPIPNQYFILDIPVSISEIRLYDLDEGLDRLESKNTSIFEKIRNRYLYYAKHLSNVSVIDASQDRDSVANDVIFEIDRILNKE